LEWRWLTVGLRNSFLKGRGFSRAEGSLVAERRHSLARHVSAGVVKVEGNKSAFSGRHAFRSSFFSRTEQRQQ
jgi:hypothetical protein